MAVDKYLKHYAEPESQALQHFPTHYQQCLAIPMYKESTEALDYFCQFAEQQQNTLLIVILNRPTTDSDTHWALQIKNALPSPHWQTDDGLIALLTLKNSSGLLMIDRCIQGEGLDKDEGVGLARKIANDVACQLIANKKISNPFIFNTDADAKLPANYFAIDIKTNADTAALLYPYYHIAENGQAPHIATQLYELSLFYYVAGLRFAGSTYSYHTLGSILAINAKHYAQVRGFPKRAGAEDFYLLNKLAKTGKIMSLQQPSIKLICRQSERVPFGTGPAVKKIIEQGSYSEMPFYDPIIFHYLKAMLELIRLCTEEDDINLAIEQLSTDTLQKSLLIEACNFLKLPAAISHAHQQGKSTDKRQRHLAIWFDGFKTLKFLHFVRERQHPMLPFKEWLGIIKHDPVFEHLHLPDSNRALLINLDK